MTTQFAETMVEVTSNGSGGRARIIASSNPDVNNPDRWSSPYHLTSAKFKTLPVGTWHIVRVKITSSHRSVVEVAETFPREYTRSKMITEFRENLKNMKIPWGEKVGDHLPETTQPNETVVESAVGVQTKSDIFIDENDLQLFQAIRGMSDKMHPAVLMIGPSGYGKTSIPERLAGDWGMNFVRWDCSTIRDPEEFFGYRAAVDGSTADEDGKQFFFETPFTKAVREGNAIIVLDELNRIDPYISNALFPLLDHAGRTTVLDHEIVIGKNVIFFATINVGHQFTGTFTLDSALSNRFIAKVLVGALPEKVESELLVTRCGVEKSVADQITKTVSKLRDLNKKGIVDVDVSTRVSIYIANMVAAGLTLRQALTYTVINGVSEDETKVIADTLGII